jgi:hypothetical protein
MLAQLDRWMARLEARHLAELQFSEVSRALRSLSSAYVERRQTAIPGRRILDGAGKRAAFALYYGPLHFVAVHRILTEHRLVSPADREQRDVIDLGCGTGAVGAALAIATGARRIQGVDVHPWALDEARETYACFGLDGITTRADAARLRRPPSPSCFVAGYLVNELPDTDRARLRRTLLDAVSHGSHLLVVEPISGRIAPWWPEWVEAFGRLGARADDGDLTIDPPDLTRRLGHAAGLTPTRVKIRTLTKL